MSGGNPVCPEFSRPVDTARLAGGEPDFEIAAVPDERTALARRFGLLALGRLEARIRLRQLAGGLVRLSASLSADVVQSCIVTLEPIAGKVEEDFTLLYGALEMTDEVVVDSETESVEPLDGTLIDIGEAVAQQLSLALDPYPRLPLAAPSAVAGAQSEPEGASPFAALAQWNRSGKTSR